MGGLFSLDSNRVQGVPDFENRDGMVLFSDCHTQHM